MSKRTPSRDQIAVLRTIAAVQAAKDAKDADMGLPVAARPAGHSSTTITLAELRAAAVAPCGLYATCTSAANRQLANHLRLVETDGLIRFNRVMSGACSLDPVESVLSLTRAGQSAINAAEHNASSSPTARASAPTWRGECAMRGSTDNPFDALRRPPVMRPGAYDFIACGSRGV